MRLISILILGGAGLTLINGIILDVFEAILVVCALVALCRGWRPWRKQQ